MQTESLDVFLTVARTGSLTAAARALGYTQSAVSRQMAVLEADIGAPLLHRLPRGVSLTDAGRALLPHAEAVLDRLAAARSELTGRTTLRIGAFPTAMAALVPRALSTLRASYPRVGVKIVEGRTPQLLERLHAGDADVAVVSAPPGQQLEPHRAELHHLLDERLLVALPAGHRLASRTTVRLAELGDEPFIAGSATAEETLLRATLPAGFRPRIDIVVADWTGKLGCVAAGLGVALVPALAVRARPQDIDLVRVDDSDAPLRRIYCAVTPGLGVPVVEHLRAAAAQLGGPRDPQATASIAGESRRG